MTYLEACWVDEDIYFQYILDFNGNKKVNNHTIRSYPLIYYITGNLNKFIYLSKKLLENNNNVNLNIQIDSSLKEYDIFDVVCKEGNVEIMKFV